MKCQYCGGKGWQRAEYGIMGKAPCPDCRGTGRIEIEDDDVLPSSNIEPESNTIKQNVTEEEQ